MRIARYEFEGRVRYGLAAVRNVGEGAIEAICKVRAARGPIRSLDALCEDLDLRLVNRRAFESLAKAGAFDSLEAAASSGETLSSISWP